MWKTFQRTDWRFVTSAGAEVTVGAMKLAFVGGGGGAFYVRRGQEQIYRLPYAGVIGGGGLGFSTSGIVSVAASLPWAPGGGYTIYQNSLRADKFGLEDFEGAFLAWTVGATGMVRSRSYTVICFGAPRWVIATGAFQLHMLLARCAGFGMLWGSALSNAAAVGMSLMRGEILTTQREQGETSSALPPAIEKIL